MPYTKHFILWKSDLSADNESTEKMRNLRNILNSHNWEELGYFEANDVNDLRTCISGINIQPGHIYFIQMDDISHLINGKPCVQDAGNNKYYLEEIDNNFINGSFKSLQVVVRGKYSGHCGANFSHLIDNNKPFKFGHSMSSYQDLETDYYDLHLHLIQFPDITEIEIWQAMQDAAHEVQAPPYNQGAGFGPLL